MRRPGGGEEACYTLYVYEAAIKPVAPHKIEMKTMIQKLEIKVNSIQNNACSLDKRLYNFE